MVSVASLARNLSRYMRARGRDAVFTRELAQPDMRTAMAALRDSLRQTPDVEHITVARDGIIATPPITGARMNVSLREGGEAGPRATALHNHPRTIAPDAVEVNGGTDGPLSPADLMVAANFPGGYGNKGFGKFAALLSDGGELLELGSVAKLTGRGRKHMASPSALNVLKALREELNDSIRYANDYGKGKMLHIPYQEAANRALDRVGLIRYGSRYTHPTARMLRLHHDYMNMVEDHLTKLLHQRVFGLPYPIRASHIGGAAVGGAAAAGGAYAASRHKRKRERRS